MTFVSLDFVFFLPIVFFLYWFVFNKALKQQNLLITISSYIFYGWWDYRFLFLIFFSSVTDFFIGQIISKEDLARRRKYMLWLSLIVNLGVLGYFKYFNFFIESFVSSFLFFGFAIEKSLVDIVLPVGISFYTFQTLSYTIDVYRKKLEPTKDFIAFTAFVSFFPQLVAGPIERATHLLPQFTKKRNFDYSEAIDGVKQILWGFFKKIAIANNCAIYANLIFNNSDNYGGSTLVLGAIFFAFQIYCDFSGYSDIAIGTARLFGFDLMQNFAFPYFSRDVAEFWRRWHISLSTWFRDYIYIPLGGSKGNTYKKARNIIIVFLVSGLWHGANWTYVIWGALNALFILPLVVLNLNRNNMGALSQDRVLPTAMELFNMCFTFLLITFSWIFFRANNITHAINIVKEIFSNTIISIPEVRPKDTFILVLFFIVIEWCGRDQKYAIATLANKWNIWFRYLFYYFLVFIMFWLGGSNQEFIYFQF